MRTTHCHVYSMNQWNYGIQLFKNGKARLFRYLTNGHNNSKYTYTSSIALSTILECYALQIPTEGNISKDQYPLIEAAYHFFKNN